jgi:hypothetical protein
MIFIFKRRYDVKIQFLNLLQLQNIAAQGYFVYD